MQIIVSITLEKIGNREIGLQLVNSVRSSFLNIGVILIAIFSLFGNTPVLII